MLNHLQGRADGLAIGAGLARFGAQRLAAIQRGAEAQAGECLRGLTAILQVMTMITRHLGDDVPTHVVRDIAAHLHAQTQALSCWNALADHATYLWQQPTIANGLARHYVTHAKALGEWPDD